MELGSLRAGGDFSFVITRYGFAFHVVVPVFFSFSFVITRYGFVFHVVVPVFFSLHFFSFPSPF